MLLCICFANRVFATWKYFESDILTAWFHFIAFAFGGRPTKTLSRVWRVTAVAALRSSDLWLWLECKQTRSESSKYLALTLSCGCWSLYKAALSFSVSPLQIRGLNLINFWPGYVSWTHFSFLSSQSACVLLATSDCVLTKTLMCPSLASVSQITSKQIIVWFWNTRCAGMVLVCLLHHVLPVTELC